MNYISKEEYEDYDKKHKQRVDMLLIGNHLIASLKNLNDAGNYGWDLSDIKKQYDKSWATEMKVSSSNVYPYDWKEGKHYKKKKIQNHIYMGIDNDANKFQETCIHINYEECFRTTISAKKEDDNQVWNIHVLFCNLLDKEVSAFDCQKCVRYKNKGAEKQ